MNVDDASVFEVNELVLAAPFNGADARSRERAKRSSRESTFERWMQHLDTFHRGVSDRRAEQTHGSLDFRKLRHALILPGGRC
jgi:hypothetical protein